MTITITKNEDGTFTVSNGTDTRTHTTLQQVNDTIAEWTGATSGGTPSVP